MIVVVNRNDASVIGKSENMFKTKVSDTMYLSEFLKNNIVPSLPKIFPANGVWVITVWIETEEPKVVAIISNEDFEHIHLFTHDFHIGKVLCYEDTLSFFVQFFKNESYEQMCKEIIKDSGKKNRRKFLINCCPSCEEENM